MANIFLIRHGQASFGAENYDQLSALGYRQTEYLGSFFKARGLEFSKVYSGAMQRHRQSLQGFCKGYGRELIAEELPDYNEFDHEQVLLVGANLASKRELAATLQAHSNPKQKLYDLFANAVARWQAAESNAEYNESWLDFKKRCQAAIMHSYAEAKTHGKSDNILVFTSGGVIATISAAILGVADARVFELNFAIANASISVVRARHQGLQLLSFNEFSYLQGAAGELLTWH